MRQRANFLVVLGLWMLTVALCAAAVALAVRDPSGWPSAYAALAVVAQAMAFSTAGCLIAWRRPETPVGWSLFAVGLVWSLMAALNTYPDYAMADGTGTTAEQRPAAWVVNWIWIFAFVSLTMFFLHFPDGRLPGRRWRIAIWCVAVGGVLLLSAQALMPGPLEAFPAIANPFGITGADEVLRSADAIGNTLIALAGVASIVSLVVRFRRSDAVLRRQLLWMALAGVLFGVFNGLASILLLLDIDAGVELLRLVSFAAVPLAAAIAILRYRLYDIDRVLSKTIVFGTLAMFVTTVFVLVVVGVGAALGQGHTNVALSIVATAVVAVLFQPGRERIQRLANRLVYGRRASPYEVLASLSRRVGEPIATEALLPEMARTLAEGTGASQAAVWLSIGNDLRLAAVWPTEGPEAPRMPSLHAEVAPGADGSRAVPVRHEGQLLGALTVTKPAYERLTPAEDKLMTDLAAQAGLALRNVRLIEELRASRQRIVAAQDAERRHLERDIHDGAQQRLVTLSLVLRMARARPGLTPGIATMLDEAARFLNEGLVEMRELARGVHPAILTDEGLGPALTGLAERSPIVTRLASLPGIRLPASVETTAYQVASHALATATHAGASVASIRAEFGDGQLVVEVTDDAPYSTELARHVPGLVDRVAALDGLLDVEASADRGRVVRAVIPCESY